MHTHRWAQKQDDNLILKGSVSNCQTGRLRSEVTTVTAGWMLTTLTSSLRVTTVRAVGSRLDADNTSLSWASFFSNVSARAPNFFSSNRFLKLLFC